MLYLTSKYYYEMLLAKINIEESKNEIKKYLISSMDLDDEAIVDYKIDIDFIFEEIEE